MSVVHDKVICKSLFSLLYEQTDPNPEGLTGLQVSSCRQDSFFPVLAGGAPGGRAALGVLWGRVPAAP